MRASLKLVTLFGITIKVHVSWIPVFLLVTWSLATNFYPYYGPQWSTPLRWLISAGTALLFFVSIIVHELMHSLVARKKGLPVGDITLFIFGGVAEIGGEPDTPGTEFLMAFAGPLVSLVLAVLFGFLGRWTHFTGLVGTASLYLAEINMLVGLFNLIPGFPLDGGRVLRAALWKASGDMQRSTLWAAQVGRGLAFLAIAFGMVQFIRGRWVDGLWIGLIGWFLASAATSSYKQVLLRNVLSQVRARDLLAPPLYALLPRNWIESVDQERLLENVRRFFSQPQQDWRRRVLVHSINAEREAEQGRKGLPSPLQVLQPAHPDEDGFSLLLRMQQAEANQVPVIDNGHMLGVVTRQRLMEYGERKRS